MERKVKNFIRNAATVTGMFLGMTRKIDFESLSRYMLGITQKNDIEDILHEASTCLKEVLNYSLFAFAVQEDDKVNVWIDPKMYRDTMEKVVKNDFRGISSLDVHHFQDADDSINETITFNSTDFISYTIFDKKYHAKLYVLPNKKILDHHKKIIEIIIKTLGAALSKYLKIKALSNAASFDPLTDCYNRRELSRMLDHNIANANRYNKDLSVIMLDIDFFKKVNDTHGHQAGDEVLKKVSAILKDTIRTSDYIARYGGEEFVIVLPDTKLSRAIELADRLRGIIEDMDIPKDESNIADTIKVTSSFGVAGLKKNGTQETMIKEADANLYKAKESGRNTVIPSIMLCQEVVVN